jgi:hypothetical protein
MFGEWTEKDLHIYLRLTSHIYVAINSNSVNLQNLTPRLYHINKSFPKLGKIRSSIEVIFGVEN